MRRDIGDESIFHLALRADWDGAVSSGANYRGSTLGKRLEEVGFIHCSFARQVQQIADALYAGRSDVVLLEIDPRRVPSEIRVENLDGGADLFPHIYGPLPVEAVVSSRSVPTAADGRLSVAPLLES